VNVYHFVASTFREETEVAEGSGTSLAADLEFLYRAAKKVQEIREDLGRVGPVIAEQVEEAIRATGDTGYTFALSIESSPKRRQNDGGLSQSSRTGEHMTEDSEWFRTGEQLSAQGFERHGLEWIQAPGRIGMDRSQESGVHDSRSDQRYGRLYEAKMTHFYDHRFGSYGTRGNERGFPSTPTDLA
jgi:hypothetical protein